MVKVTHCISVLLNVLIMNVLIPKTEAVHWFGLFGASLSYTHRIYRQRYIHATCLPHAIPTVLY